jgi:hypothetical protein
MNSIWFTCEDCQYTAKILSCEASDTSRECPLCGGKMLPEPEKEETQQPIGDNFPQVGVSNIATIEQELQQSVNILGASHTWYFIEAVSDIKVRLRYRNVFFNLGYKIPEREDINESR